MRKAKVKISWYNSPDQGKKYITKIEEGSLANVLASAKNEAQKKEGKKLQIDVEEASYI